MRILSSTNNANINGYIFRLEKGRLNVLVEIEKVTEKREFEGLFFVACMFIGAGLGLAFGRPDVGGAIGMGVGFLLMAILRVKRVKPTPITLSLPRSFGQLALLALGILVILSGVCLLYNPDLLYPYIVGIGIIVIGLLILLGGLLGWSKKEMRKR